MREAIYNETTYLGSSQDMAKHKYDAYKIDDEIHIVYKSNHVAKEKISKIQEDLDKYLWTPYVEWVEF